MSTSFLDGYPAAVKKLLEKHIIPRQLSRIARPAEHWREAKFRLKSAAQNYSRLQHWEPIIEIVRHLPKEELVGMAEALVNLTSCKRHVTSQADVPGAGGRSGFCRICDDGAQLLYFRFDYDISRGRAPAPHNLVADLRSAGQPGAVPTWFC